MEVFPVFHNYFPDSFHYLVHVKISLLIDCVTYFGVGSMEEILHVTYEWKLYKPMPRFALPHYFVLFATANEKYPT